MDELIDELKGFIEDLNNVDSSWSSNEMKTDDWTVRNNTITEMTLVLNNVRDRVDRFYTENSAYRNQLFQIQNALDGFRNLNIERLIGIGKSLDDLKLETIGIIKGFINGIEKYGTPSDKDHKFDG